MNPPDSNPTGDRLLVLKDVQVVYNRIIQVLHGVSLVAKPGAITALLGGNGAGKTTTLKAISCLLKSERGEMTGGSARESKTKKSSTRFFSSDISKS